MNLDKKFIYFLLVDKKLDFDEKIKRIESTGHVFDSFSLPVYNFIKDFYKKHKKQPSVSIVKEKFPAYNINLDVNSVSDEPFDYYIDLAFKNKKKLQLIQFLSVVDNFLQKDMVDDALEFYATSVKSIDIKDDMSSDLSIKNSFDEFYSLYKSRYDLPDNYGYKIGVKSIDDVTFGIFPGDYWLLIGRPGSNKTWVLCVWAVNMLKYVSGKGQILFFSKEMKARQIYARMLAVISETSYSMLRRYKITPKNLKQFKKFIDKLESDIIIVDSVPKVSEVKRKIMQYDTKIFFLDGLYLFSSGVDWEKVTEASQIIRNTALSLDVPAIVSSQFNRRGSGSLKAENIAYSDSLYQDGSVVIGQERVVDKVLEKKTNILRWKILKNRDEDDGQVLYGTLDFQKSRILDGINDSEMYWEIDDADISDIGSVKKESKKIKIDIDKSKMSPK